jgi:hypothetical protein
MRKILALILSVTMLFTMGIFAAGCSSDEPDYSDPFTAALSISDKDITGKTVNVTASMDYENITGVGGTIYKRDDGTVNSTVYVCVSDGTGNDIKKGQKVRVKITSAEVRNMNIYYIHGTVIKK